MATWADVKRIMKAIPAAVQTNEHHWRVKDKYTVWERPLRKPDLEALGTAAPAGAVLGVYVPLEVKEALLASKRGGYFTVPHFAGYPYVLVELAKARAPALKKLLVSSCEARAAKPRRGR